MSQLSLPMCSIWPEEAADNTAPVIPGRAADRGNGAHGSAYDERAVQPEPFYPRICVRAAIWGAGKCSVIFCRLPPVSWIWPGYERRRAWSTAGKSVPVRGHRHREHAGNVLPDGSIALEAKFHDFLGAILWSWSWAIIFAGSIFTRIPCSV